MRRRRLLAALATLAMVVTACTTDPRAIRLSLQTETRAREGACDSGALVPVRIEREADAITFVDGTGRRVSIVWPFGFAAWGEFGSAVLYARDGSVVGREGDVLDTIGGAADAEGFHVCRIGVRTYS